MAKQKSQIPFSQADLYRPGGERTFTGTQLQQVAFPIGGIGTGSISMSGSGALVDWEIFNRPSKGFRPTHSFFSLWTKQAKCDPEFRILEGQLLPHYIGGQGEHMGIHGYGFGPAWLNEGGLLRMRECSFTGSYPFGRVDLSDPKIPVSVSIEAFNPFIPCNAYDSSLPVAVFMVTLTNQSSKLKTQATLGLNVQNHAGGRVLGGNVNEYKMSEPYRGLFMTNTKHKSPVYRSSSMAIATPHQKGSYQTAWYRPGWFDTLQHFVDTFGKNGMYDNDGLVSEPSADGQSPVGSLGMSVKLNPKESVQIPVVIAWYFPWTEVYWRGSCGCKSGEECELPKFKNWYATQFDDAWQVADYTLTHLERLEQQTRQFQQELFNSTVPGCVIEAVSSQISILKTPTTLRCEDGTFYGFEGCCYQDGCCEGTCTHVWNYAQALPYLFPELERSIRDADYNINLRESDGHMQFRMPLPLGTPADHGFHAAADGQLGGVMKTYREWLMSGDTEWLRNHWENIKKQLEYAWVEWDKKRQGVIDGVHHNTYDIEFHNSEPMAGVFYLGALRAAQEMARLLGDDKAEQTYRDLYQSGRKFIEKNNWNGEYFHQVGNVEKEPTYQYGKGCLSDQLIGQWYAEMLGLGYLLPPAKIRRALESVFKNNWKPTLAEHHNPQRVYALGDEQGLLLCTWPRKGRPDFPFPYSDEVWCGIEYQVASHLIMEGFLDEGLAIVKGVRDRHDGVRRNPYNEFECGSHYARSLASWAVLNAITGFRCRMADGMLRFAPQINQDNFRGFFSLDGAWGSFTQKLTRKKLQVTIQPAWGQLQLQQLELSGLPEPGVWSAPSPVQCLNTKTGVVLKWETPLEVSAENPMKVTLSK